MQNEPLTANDLLDILTKATSVTKKHESVGGMTAHLVVLALRDGVLSHLGLPIPQLSGPDLALYQHLKNERERALLP